MSPPAPLQLLQLHAALQSRLLLTSRPYNLTHLLQLRTHMTGTLHQHKIMGAHVYDPVNAIQNSLLMLADIML